MISTNEWAKSLDIAVENIPPSVEDYFETCPRTAQEIAVRSIILQGVVAVSCEVDPAPIIDWFHEQHIWEAVTPQEQAFLLSITRPDQQCTKFRAHQEAEWALLWAIGKVDSLGLPTRFCDTRRLIDEIMPALGSNIEPFVASAHFRHPGRLLAEDLRTYNMWCYALRDRRENKPLPHDLNLTVLYERRYAFEWLDGVGQWDEITCDA